MLKLLKRLWAPAAIGLIVGRAILALPMQYRLAADGGLFAGLLALLIVLHFEVKAVRRDIERLGRQTVALLDAESGRILSSGTPAGAKPPQPHHYPPSRN